MNEGQLLDDFLEKKNKIQRKQNVIKSGSYFAFL